MPYDPNDAETKAAVKAAVEAAIAEATTGLVEKNKELLGKLKKATKDAAIDPAEHQALQSELEQTQAKLVETSKALKVATGEVDKHKKAYETEAQYVQRLIADNGLIKELTENKIKPELMDGVLALLSKDVAIRVNGEERAAFVGDKPLKDFVSEWAKSDKGKHYVAAPANQGGGAQGSGTKIQNAKSWAEMTLDEKTNLYKTNPEQAKILQTGGGGN